MKIMGIMEVKMNNIFVLCRYDRETHDTDLIQAFTNEQDAESTCENYVSKEDSSIEFHYLTEVSLD